MAEEQEKFLEDAKKVVKEQAYFMKKALDSASLRDALKYASTMLYQLTTSCLSPKNYFILFMQIFDQMRSYFFSPVLEAYFKQQFRRGRKMIDLYQAVQHAAKLIPRTYLLITVGSVFIQSHQQGSEKVLDDLIQMLKVIKFYQAIQNPLRGLFIRSYFLKLCKDRLPDKGSQYQTQTHSVRQAFDILFTNLSQSNRLWIRLQQGRDKSKKEKQRLELKVLIGQNIHRIASLQGINIQLYKSQVLPKMLQLIKSSKDFLSQQFILDCIIQAFPDQFHIETLEEMLTTCTSGLQVQVDIKAIFINLMDRLAEYSSQVSPPTPLYELFQKNINNLISQSQAFESSHVLNLLKAFLKFTLKCYPGNTEYINQILKSCIKVAEKAQIGKQQQKTIGSYLTIVMGGLGVSVLSMNQFPNLMNFLSFTQKRQVSFQITKTILKHNIPLINTELVQQLLIFIRPLLRSDKDYQLHTIKGHFEKQQNLVAKLVALVKDQDVQPVVEVIMILIQQFRQGGQQRMIFTLPPCVFKLLSILKTFAKPAKLLKYLNQILNSLRFAPQLFINLSLQMVMSCQIIDEQKKYDQFVYEILSQALSVYQQDIVENRQNVLQSFIGVMCKMKCLSQQNYDVIASNITKFSTKLLKKMDQCKMLLKCLYLFYNQNFVNYYNQKQQQRLLQIFKKLKKLGQNLISQSQSNVYIYLLVMSKIIYFAQFLTIPIANEIYEQIETHSKHLKEKQLKFSEWLKKRIQKSKQKGLFQEIKV